MTRIPPYNAYEEFDEIGDQIASSYIHNDPYDEDYPDEYEDQDYDESCDEDDYPPSYSSQFCDECDISEEETELEYIKAFDRVLCKDCYDYLNGDNE